MTATVGLVACSKQVTSTATVPPSSATVMVVPLASATIVPSATQASAPEGTVTPRATANQVPTVAPSPTETPTAVQIVTPCLSADTVWRQVNPLSKLLVYHGFVSPDSCQVWLVGLQVGNQRQAVVLHSVDGGQTLEVVATPDASMLWQVGFSEPTSGWVVGDNSAPDQSGIVLHSTDGGLSWSQVPVPVESPSMAYLAFSDNTIWIGGNNNGHVNLVSSPDDGATWTSAPIAGVPITHLEGITASGNSVMLVGASDDRGLVAISHDNGHSFGYQLSLGGMSMASTAVLLNQSRAYVGGYFAPGGVEENATAILVYTDDGGATWQPVAVPEGTIQIVDLYFQSDTTGYGTINAIHRVTASPDGALVWGEPEILEPTPVFGGVSFFFGSADGTIFAVGSGGLYRSKP